MLELISMANMPVDLLPGSITMFQGLAAGEVSTAPEARCLVKHRMGKKLHSLLVKSQFGDVVMGLNINALPNRGGWMLLDLKDGDRLAIRPSAIVIREALEEGCALVLTVNDEGDTATYHVKQSRNEIKQMMDQTLGMTPIAPIEAPEALAVPEPKKED